MLQQVFKITILIMYLRSAMSNLPQMVGYRQLAILNVNEELELAKVNFFFCCLLSLNIKLLDVKFKDIDRLIFYDEIEIPIKFELNRTLLNRVVNQGRCGSCYALTVANFIESSLVIQATKMRNDDFKSVSLSAQQIINCTRNIEYRNYGYRGGSVRSTMEYARYEGLILDKDYPYTGRQGLYCMVSGQLLKVLSCRFIRYSIR